LDPVEENPVSTAEFQEVALSPEVWLGEHAQPRHLKITGAAPAFGFERCEDTDCHVGIDGNATSCGRIACPMCGCGGTNLTTIGLLSVAVGVRVGCSCGYSWVSEARFPPRLAALAVVD
jgi:hypothetical protein